MLEPLAAAVLNSLRSGRPSVTYSAMVARDRSKKPPFQTDFFTPRARTGKGKEKAQESLENVCSHCLYGGSTGRSCITKHSPWYLGESIDELNAF
jgi:hypothetical protein